MQALLCLVLLSLFLLLHVGSSATCPTTAYVDSYSNLPAGAIFPTATLSAALTPTPNATNPLTQNHWSEVARLADYRPPAMVPSANPSRTNCPYLAGNLKNWHDPATWAPSGIPGNGSDFTLPINTSILIASCSVDPSFVFGTIVIPATSSLVFSDAAITLQAKGMTVQGSLLIGSATCRLRNKVTITLFGSRAAQSLPAPSAVKGIAVTGQIDVHGMQFFPTWTRLAMTANKGDTIIFVQDLVNWQVGQTIFITTTDLKDARDWHTNEVRTIVSVKLTTLGSNVAAVELNQALVYKHFGGREYQAEVGLMSRNVLIQGDPYNSDPTDTANPICTDSGDGSTYPCSNQYLTGFGGHVQVMGASAVGRFSGVELYRMGQTNILGRYPLHFHMINTTDSSKAFIQDCSVHQSFFRCYVIHGTHGVLFSQNTAYDAIGSCFYLSEDGVEEGSTIQYNLAAHIHVLGNPQNPSTGGNGDSWWGQTLSWYNSGPNLLIPADISAAGFYITNMNNTIVGNAASGGWTGFSFPSLPLPIGDFSSITNFNPANRPFMTPFRGNSAHSSGFWWGTASAFYLGGQLSYTDASKTTLTYTAGRTVNMVHDTCVDKTAGTPNAQQSGCWDLTDKLWLTLQDNKAFLTNRGLQAWGNRAEIIRMEIHDAPLSMNVFGMVWISNLLMNCRSTNLPTWFSGCPTAPPKTQSPAWGLCSVRDYYFFSTLGGFQWYDTGQQHILESSTFRNCRNNWSSCIYGPAGTCDGSAVFTSLTHSDQYVPQLMQASKNLTFDNSSPLWRSSTDTTDNMGITVSGRLQSWLDVDGSASGSGVASMIGSTWGGGWWNMSGQCTTYLQNYVCPLKTGDAAASMYFTYNAAEQGAIGGAICVNGNSGGDKPCPLVGNVTHFGRVESTGLPLAVNAQVTGPIIYQSGGWFVRFTSGTPKVLTISDVQLDPTANLILAFPYPAGTTFTINYQGATWCGPTWAVCTHAFRKANTLTEVVNGFGDLYYWDNTAKTLFLRIVQRGSTFGNVNTDANWTSIPPVPEKFTRAGITINVPTGDATVVITASCGDPCAAQPTVAVPAALRPAAITTATSASSTTSKTSTTTPTTTTTRSSTTTSRTSTTTPTTTTSRTSTTATRSSTTTSKTSTTTSKTSTTTPTITTTGSSTTSAPTATATATPTSTPSSSGTIKVTYQVVWTNGNQFGALVTISPQGRTISGWSVNLQFKHGETIDSFWQANLTPGTTYTFTNLDSNGNVAAGKMVSFGFNGRYNGNGEVKGSGQPVISSFVASSSSVPSGQLEVQYLPDANVESPPAGPYQDNFSGGLTTGQLVGIIVGGAVGVLAVVGAIVGVLVYKGAFKKAGKKSPSSMELSQNTGLSSASLKAGIY